MNADSKEMANPLLGPGLADSPDRRPSASIGGSISGLPLEGVRVLAVEQFGAGPFGTMVLADLGAEVIKIEDPATDGDVARTVPPYRLPNNDSLYYQSFNRNKRSIGLNLRDADGRRIFHDLVKVSEAVFNNLRGDLPRKLGLDYEALKAVNPRIVCCSLSGFGTTGPRAAEPGYDYLMQGYAGIMSITGEPDSPPARCGVPIIDFTGGYVSMLGLMIGLHAAQRTGVGRDVDVGLLDCGVAVLSYLANFHLNEGYEPAKIADSAHATLVPSQCFSSKDGYLIVMCFKEKFWERLCTLIGRLDLPADPRFKQFPDRLANREILIPILRDVFRARTTEEWLGILRGHVPCAPVNTVAEALRDPQVLSREMVVEVPHPARGTLREVGNPIKVSGPEIAHQPGPALGQDTDAVLGQYLDIGPERLADLRARGVIA